MISTRSWWRAGASRKRSSRLHVSFLVALLLGVVSACDPGDDGSQNTAGITESEWLLVNYWATWCSPCRKEIPELNELHAQYHAGLSTLAIFGVNFDSPNDNQAAEDIASMGIEFRSMSMTQAEELGLSKPNSLPTTYLLHNKQLKETLYGPQTISSIQAAQAAAQASIKSL